MRFNYEEKENIDFSYNLLHFHAEPHQYYGK